MKTLTEFSGFVLKDALTKKTALLAEGKTEDEAQGAINEQLKLDEAKAAFYRNVVDMTSSRIDRVKRVVVALKASETEKVPESYIEREGHFYLVEYFPGGSSHRDAPSGRERGRGDRGRSERGGRGRGGPGNPDRGRGEGARNEGPRAEGRFAERKESGDRNERGPRRDARGPDERKPRPERPAKTPRPPRPPRSPDSSRAPRGPKGAGELRLVLKGQSQTTLPGSATPVTGAGVNEVPASISGETQQA